MGQPHQTEVPATLDHLRDAVSHVADCARHAGLDSRATSRLELAAEEAIANIVSYAYPDKPGPIRIACHCDGDDGLTVRIEDDGIAFDVLAAEPRTPPVDLEHCKEGGIGIPMIRRLTDNASYRRDGTRNILTLVVKRGGSGE